MEIKLSNAEYLGYQYSLEHKKELDKRTEYFTIDTEDKISYKKDKIKPKEINVQEILTHNPIKNIRTHDILTQLKKN